MSQQKVGERSQAWLVLALIGVACLFNFVWLSYDRTPPHWDFAGHLRSAFKYRDLLASFIHGDQPDFVNFLRRLVHVDSAVYPPLVPLTASLVSPTLSLRSLVMVNSLFLAILVFSVYQIGRRLHSELAGLLGAAFIVSYPIAIHMSHEFMMDYPLLAMTALSGYLLVASDEFRSPRETYLFGISAGLGMLTKPTYASFIIVPACYTLARAVIRTTPPQDRATRLRNLGRLGLALLIGGLLASLWYIPNFRNMHAEAVRIAAQDLIGFGVFDVNSLLYYLNILVVDQIGLPFTALLFFGLAVARKRLAARDATFLLLWLAGIYILATLAPFKEYEQDIGILVPISVISGVALAGLTRFRKTICGATLLYAAVQFVALSLPFSGLGERIGAFKWAVYFHGSPSTEGWQIEEALMSLGRPPLAVAVLSDHKFINSETVEYYARSLGMSCPVYGRYDGHLDRILDSEIVMLKSDWVPYGATRGISLRGVETRGVGVMYTTGRCLDFRERPSEPATNMMTRRDLELEGRSVILQRSLFRKFPLPDGSELLVYR